MAQNEESFKPPQKSPNSHLSCVNCSDTSISSFDLLTPYRSNKHNRAAVSAAAALFLQAATADNGNQRKSMSHSLLKRSSSPSNGENTMANAAAAAATLMSHSPNTNSQLQAALALAMAAASPSSTRPSSSSSGQPHPEQHNSSENFRSDSRTSPSIFRSPSGYETVDGGGGGNDMVFPSTTMRSGNISNFSQFTGSTTSPDLSAPACLTNAMLLPASIVNAIGHQMQAGQDYSQAAYLSTIGNNNNNIISGNNNNNNSSQFTGDQSSVVGSGGYGANISTISPSNTDTGRFSSASRASSATLQEDSNHKREQRLLKNREAARECRRKKKEYVRCLERQVAILQNQNQKLIDELQKMKALCTNDRPMSVLVDSTNNNSSSNSTATQGSLKDRRLTDGMDFVDSVAPHAFRRGDEQIHHHPRHRLTTPSSPPCSTPATGAAPSSYKMEVDSSSQRRNQLDAARDFNTDQQMLFLHSVASAALKNHHLDERNSGDYNWFNRKSTDHQDSSSSDRERFPHIPPLKRALKEFGQKQEQQQQQQRRMAHQHPVVDKIEPTTD